MQSHRTRSTTSDEDGNKRKLQDSCSSTASTSEKSHNQKVSFLLQELLEHDRQNIPLTHFPNDIFGCERIAKRFNLPISANCTSHAELFEEIQRMGLLNACILKLFATADDCHAVSFEKSYGQPLGMLSAVPRVSPRLCTVPLLSTGKGEWGGLRRLSLSTVRITDEELRYLIKLKGLRHLDLSFTLVTSNGIVYLGRYASFAKKLGTLILSGARRIDDRCADAIESFPRLGVLRLAHTCITQRGLWQLGRALKQASQIKDISIPRDLASYLKEMHARFYYGLPSFSQIQNLPKEEVSAALQKLGNFYKNGTILPESSEELRKIRLSNILETRIIEEFIWAHLEHE